MTSDNIAINSSNFNVDENGNVNCNNATMNDVTITSGILKLFNGTESNPKFSVTESDYITFDNLNGVAILPDRIWMRYGSQTCFWIARNNYGGVSMQMPHASFINLYNISGSGTIRIDGGDGNISCVSLTQTSKEEQKKNFERFNGGLDIIKNTDIYKYNLKSQKDGDKKHIGFVIGKNYKYSKEITSKNNDGVDTYSMISVAYKAIQEQQELIESLQKQIDEMKGDK